MQIFKGTVISQSSILRKSLYIKFGARGNSTRATLYIRLRVVSLHDSKGYFLRVIGIGYMIISL
jgi:hypothetical protein